MVKEIVKDIEVLSQKSEKFEFGKDDYLIQDMLDTAEYHKENCVGLACIQIGTPKRIILVRQNDRFIPFINPIIIWKGTKTYKATEGCLSVEGLHEVKRYNQIRVAYTEYNGKTKVINANGFFAEIIQHEIDHLNGVLI